MLFCISCQECQVPRTSEKTTVQATVLTKKCLKGNWVKRGSFKLQVRVLWVLAIFYSLCLKDIRWKQNNQTNLHNHALPFPSSYSPSLWLYVLYYIPNTISTTKGAEYNFLRNSCDRLLAWVSLNSLRCIFFKKEVWCSARIRVFTIT